VRLKLICCEVMYREFCQVVARSVNLVDMEFLPKGLHDMGSPRMLARLQSAVDQVDAAQYDAVILGYGLCGNGLVGLTARSMPIVIPRAHDCITLFLGNKERYLEYFQQHPGVYFETSGWLERGDSSQLLSQLALQGESEVGYRYEDLVAKYGEDNARYLYETLGDLTRNYRQFTYIETGVEPDDRFERQTREQAARRGWQFDKLIGELSLMKRLVDGQWDEREFLVVPPGRRLVARYDESVIGAEE
jgi:hypothetical protein